MLQNVTINSSQVLDVFLAGLQDGLTPCAKNATSTTSTASGSPAYFSNIASVRIRPPPAPPGFPAASCFR